jgi:mRNA interferase MazF
MERVVQRGDIWWADLGSPKGSEPGYRRPVVVVQDNDFNRSAISTVIVVAVTTNMDLARAPGNVTCRPRAGGLSRASIINISQIATVDRKRLVDRIGRLPESVMRQVDDGLRLILTL